MSELMNLADELEGESCQGCQSTMNMFAASLRSLDAQHERIVAGYGEAARELDKWLIPLLSGKLHSVDHGPYLKWRTAIDAFLAQTAEGV